MTVCIAAVCNVIEGRSVCVIAAADRMITIGDIQYEPAQTKSVFFATNTIGLFAGDMQLHAAVVPKVQKRIVDALHDNPTNINVADIAELYAEEFAYYRRSLAEREILIPRGLNFDRFLARQATMAHWQVSDLDSRLASFYVDSTAIIAGVDPTGAHIFKIFSPGMAMCLDTPFFTCAGSGEYIATTRFMTGKFDKTWPIEDALWLTFRAKAQAEIAGGVGRQTDIALILPGQTHVLTDEQKVMLYALLHEAEKKERAASRDAVAELHKYMLAKASEEPQDMTQTASERELPKNDDSAKKTKKLDPKDKSAKDKPA